MPNLFLQERHPDGGYHFWPTWLRDPLSRNDLLSEKYPYACGQTREMRLQCALVGPSKGFLGNPRARNVLRTVGHSGTKARKLRRFFNTEVLHTLIRSEALRVYALRTASRSGVTYLFHSASNSM